MGEQPAQREPLDELVTCATCAGTGMGIEGEKEGCETCNGRGYGVKKAAEDVEGMSAEQFWPKWATGTTITPRDACQFAEAYAGELREERDDWKQVADQRQERVKRAESALREARNKALNEAAEIAMQCKCGACECSLGNVDQILALKDKS